MKNIGPFLGRTVIDFDELDDIFLITGKTGAGKTTIFDALCYVLYGSLPGSRESTVHRLRSDFAAPDDTCFVQLDFSLGSRRYRVERSPKQERPKKRGSGVTVEDETALLYELIDSNYVALSGKKSDIDEKIRSLIGLSDKEFQKIVLLPQGEFAEFLRQNTKDRKEVLLKLFPVDLAVRVKELALARSRDLSAQLKIVEQNLEEAAHNFSVDTEEEAFSAAEKALEKAKQKASAAETMIQQKQDELRLLEEENTIKQRLVSAQKDITALEGQQEEIEAKKIKIEQNRLALPLYQQLEKLRELQTEISRLQEQKARAAEAVQEAEEFLAELLKRKASIDKTEIELNELKEKKGPLIKAAETEEALQEEQAEQSSLVEQIEQSKMELEQLNVQVNTIQKDLALHEKTAAGSDTLEKRTEWARESMRLVRQLRDLSLKMQPLLEQQHELKDKVNTIQTELDKIHKTVPVLREENEALKKQKAQHEDAENAARLALHLEAGKPCPVCGSTEHPLPAAAIAREFGLDERIEALEQSIRNEELRLEKLSTQQKSLEQDTGRVQKELDSYQNEYSNAERELQSLYESYHDYADYLPDTRQLYGDSIALGKELEKRSAAATEINNARTAAARAKDRSTQLYRELNELEQKKAATSTKLGSMEERLKNRSHQLKEKREGLQQLLEAWRTESVAYALSMLTHRMQEIETEIQSYRTDKEQALRQETSAKTRIQSLEIQIQERTKQLEQETASFDSALQKSVFTDIEQLETARLDSKDEQDIDREIQAWKEQLNTRKGLYGEIENSLDQLQKKRRDQNYTDDEAALKACIQEQQQIRSQAEAERDQAAAAAAALEKDRRMYQEALEKRKTLSEKAAVYKKLSDDLNGNNHKKRSFDAWLLAMYLEEVAAYAGKRLQRMSEGRYSLILNTEGEGRNKLAGLDLAVFDAYTGKTRPCATLSGGESFMASISLALGLADSIQARSGAVRLDAVFIDEGFGSLDEASLDKALGILDEIRDHRMVGLISHVSDMKNRIPSRIDVIKSGNGSSVRICSD